MERWLLPFLRVELGHLLPPPREGLLLLLFNVTAEGGAPVVSDMIGWYFLLMLKPRFLPYPLISLRYSLNRHGSRREIIFA